MPNPFGFQFYPGKRLPAVCRDGVIRSAVITGQPDTCFSMPGAVQVTAGGKRRTVAGSLYHDREGKVCFGAYSYRANHVFIPLTKHKPRLAAAALRLIKATAYGRGAPGYIWDCPADHSAALARGSILWFATSQWPEGGFAARAVLRRLPAELLPQLCRFFDKLTALYKLHNSINGERLTPPPPPPA